MWTTQWRLLPLQTQSCACSIGNQRVSLNTRTLKNTCRHQPFYHVKYLGYKFQKLHEGLMTEPLMQAAALSYGSQTFKFA